MRNKYALKSLKHAQIFQNFSRAQLLDILSTNENIGIVSETMNSKEKIIFRVELGVAKRLTANQRNRVRREMLASIQHTRVSSLFFLKYVRCGLESHIVSSITLSEALRSFAQTVRDYKFSDFVSRKTSDYIFWNENLLNEK